MRRTVQNKMDADDMSLATVQIERIAAATKGLEEILHDLLETKREAVRDGSKPFDNVLN